MKRGSTFLLPKNTDQFSLSLTLTLSTMCVKIQKQLNPAADEWRPISAPPPPPPRAFILPSLPPPPQLVVAPHYYHYTYTISFPAKKAAPPPPCEEIISHRSPKSAPKRCLPPRLRRARNVPPPPPPSPKLEWRPKNTPPAVPAKAAGGGDRKTTLMIRNIPNQLRRDFMLKFLDGYCKTHTLLYDFFYLPIDFKRLGNLGYAFLNFTSAVAAAKMMKLLSNYKWRSTYDDDGEFVSTRKVCAMKWARIQGKEELVRRFSKSCFNCDEEEFLPVLLDPARNGSDTNPPRPITLGRLCGPARRSVSH